MDFGKITVPTKWDDITLKQFQELMKIYSQEDKDILDILSLFTQKSKKELRQMPSEFIETMLVHLQFMNTKLEVEPSSQIDIDGKIYKINYTEKLKFGEFVDVETLIKEDKYNWAAILAMLCRLEGEVYDDDFIADKLDGRIKMYEEMPINKALQLINFFLKLKLRYITYSLRSSILKEGKEEVESLVQSIRDSLKDGAGTRLNSIYAKIELRKLEKQLRCI